jgi:hypothetical protein
MTDGVEEYLGPEERVRLEFVHELVAWGRVVQQDRQMNLSAGFGGLGVSDPYVVQPDEIRRSQRSEANLAELTKGDSRGKGGCHTFARSFLW